MNIKKWLYLQKEGAIVGGLAGAGLNYLGWSLPLNIPVEGIPKLIIMVVFFGLIGMGLDAIIDPEH